MNEEFFARRLQAELDNTSTYKMQALQKEADEVKKRLQLLDRKFDQMYEDKLSGVLPVHKFLEMTKNTESEHQQLTEKLAGLESQIAVQETVDDSISRFMDIVRKYTEVKQLDSELLNRLIDKIVVGNKVKSGNSYTQRITIYYRFVGDLGSVDLSK